MGGTQRLWLTGAFLLGVGLTVGAYEISRVVTNTRQALQAASSGIGGEEPQPKASSAKRGQAPKRAGAKRGKRRAVKKTTPKGPDRGVTPQSLPSRGGRADRPQRAARELRRRRRVRSNPNRRETPRIGGSLIPTPLTRTPSLPLEPPVPASPAEPLEAPQPGSPRVDTGK